MRKAFVLLLALLTLTGCGSTLEEPENLPEEPPAVETASLPELTPLGVLSAPAVVTEGRTPAEPYELPKKICRNPIADGDFPLLLAELPEEDAAFYGLQWETALIRWGDCLAEFDWLYLTPRQILPRLFCLDFDGDWKDELVVVCYTGSGTGIAYEELHVLERGPEGTLTDYALPREMFTEVLSGAMSAVTVNGRTYVILGTELVDITGILWENSDPEAIEGLGAGDIVYFEATPDSPFGHHFRYQGAAWLYGETFIPTVSYAVDLEAIVSYKDGVFTLSDIQLS